MKAKISKINLTPKSKKLAHKLVDKMTDFAIDKMERKLLQARINAELYERLRERLKLDELTIQEFIEAAAAAYLTDDDIEV